jgi:voltage-gated potassium channel
VPKTEAGRFFLLVMLLTGLVVVTYSLGTIVNILVETQLTGRKEKEKMQKAIENLDGHTIICGAGRVGAKVADAFFSQSEPYVVIETNESVVNQMREDGHLVLHGDATRDEMLLAAGITRAKGIVCALASDAYNVYVVITARALNPKLTIVSRAVQPESVAKLRHAGADKIISPDQIGGHRMAMAILKPSAIELMDTLFAPHNVDIQMEEVLVRENAALAHRQVMTFFGSGVSAVMLVSIIRQGQVKMNPSASETILPNDVLVLIGSVDELKKIEQHNNA